MTQIFPISLRDTSAINRIILTAHDMCLYLHNSNHPMKLHEDEVQKILIRYLKEDTENTELSVCELGKYTLINDIGYYVFFATMENI